MYNIVGEVLNMKIIDKINQELLKEKTRKSARYEYGENIPNSSKKALEELDINHDTSWFEEIYKRNKNNLDFAALLYRGNKITYKEMFEKAYKYAKSLK